MLQYMKYISDSYQEVIKLEEDPNGTYTIGKGFLPLVKIEDPDEDEDTEYIAVKLILGDEAIQYQMLPADHGQESNENIRIIPIQENCLLYLDSDLETPTEVVRNTVSWLDANMDSLENAIKESQEYVEAIRVKNGWENECLNK